MGVIVYNSISSTDLHAQVEHLPGYAYPKQDYDIYHVPGRNGDIVVSKGSYQNTKREYELAVYKEGTSFHVLANGISEWLHSATNYARLEDSYEPEYYRLALYEEEQSIENVLGLAGKCKISFNCKPQRFLKTGERTYYITSDTEILRNPTRFASQPKITVHGSGSGAFSVNGQRVEISDIIDGMIVDSFIQDAYLGTSNLNRNISLGEFPTLKYHDNTISKEGGITSLEIVPNWWTL